MKAQGTLLSKASTNEEARRRGAEGGYVRGQSSLQSGLFPVLQAMNTKQKEPCLSQHDTSNLSASVHESPKMWARN
ncbi:unnamed protein product [Arctogadus glacialis]